MRVLILGGGGTLGAFSAGALRALSAAGWTPDAFIGSSAGSINLLRSMAGGADEAVAFWTTLDWKTLLREAASHNVLRAGLLEPGAFHARVDAGLDYAKLLKDPRPVGFIVVDLGTGKVCVRGNRTEKTADDLRLVAHGSYSLPPLLPAVQVTGNVIADGGLLLNAPLEAALRLGATEVVYLCNVQVLPTVGWQQASTLRTMGRYLDIYFRRTSNVGFADAHIVEGKYRGVPFLTIAPPRSVHLGSLARWMLPTPRASAQLVRNGEQWAREALCVAAGIGSRVARPGGAAPDFARTAVGG